MAKKIDQLTAHSYISKSAAAHLNSLKQNLDEKTCIVLADSLLVQDAVQGWYFSKEHCTLHPIVVYYKNSEGKLENMNLAFMSDDTTHYNCFVSDLQN